MLHCKVSAWRLHAAVLRAAFPDVPPLEPPSADATHPVPASPLCILRSGALPPNALPTITPSHLTLEELGLEDGANLVISVARNLSLGGNPHAAGNGLHPSHEQQMSSSHNELQLPAHGDKQQLSCMLQISRV